MNSRGGSKTTSSEQAVLAAAQGVVAAAQRLEQWYAVASPIRSDQMADLLRKAQCLVNVFPFRSEAVAFTQPPVAGVYPIAINKLSARTDRRLALRHELAHVLCGSVDEPTYLTEEGYLSHEERVCDLFALADLIPAHLIAFMRKRRSPWRDVLEEVRGAIETYASSWPADRLDDRSALRVALYREQGI